MTDSEKRAAIPRPSICRMVVIAHRDGTPFMNGPSELPGTVIRVLDDETLRIEADAPVYGVVTACHRDLVPDGGVNPFVWYWPPRA